MEETKKCSACGAESPKADFPRKSGKCRRCVNARVRAYQQKNKEKGVERVRAWRMKNLERRRQQARECARRRRADPEIGKRLNEERKEYSKSERAKELRKARVPTDAHKEYMRSYLKAYTPQWRHRNPDKEREIQRRRRARIRTTAVEAFHELEIYRRDRGICQLCNSADPIDLRLPHLHPKGFTLDHIISLAEGGSHTRANVQAAHRICNSRKGRGTGGRFRAGASLRLFLLGSG